MRKSKQPDRLLGGVFCALIAATSCHKGDKAVTPQNVTTTTTTVDTLPQTIYTSIDSSGTPTPGIILAAPVTTLTTAITPDPGMVMIMNQDGWVLKEQQTTGQAFDFNRWIINGQTYYTYIVNNPSAYRAMGVDQDEGYAVIADSNLNTVQQVNFTPFGDYAFQATQGLDIHNFLLISPTDYITESYIIKQVTNIPSYVPHIDSAWVIAPLIEEVSNGNVVWSWDASTDTALYANAAVGNNFLNPDTAQDYVHLNSITIDPRDNNLILSMRNQCQVMKINRQTGAVMWKLGGKNSDFALTSNEVFLFQHHATLADSNQTLLLFDDGDPILRPYSRIDEFQLDETNKVVTNFKTFDIPEAFTDVMGSVQKMGNEYFIGGGSANYILEVNYVTGQKVMELKSSVWATYRAFKY
ncbi:aryl-sulfate sulfotransferase [Dinghuibacter silviterrae]|uniref:Arylsulfotransferase ASST n=1 Tax=Dinghuibacter silviterrae TaxID=1539049 RepID=A0A4R8DRE2_9BACT|nr:aryl-sulfate sulfotransferase [Dinghuibacter silviterrae]TDX00539.1 arylsulfotransferase ASST [Dinghuibacter silviterrae]